MIQKEETHNHNSLEGSSIQESSPDVIHLNDLMRHGRRERKEGKEKKIYE